MNAAFFDDLIRNALAEDGVGNDVTTMATVSLDRKSEGRFIAKEDGVVCGLPILSRVFALLDGDVLVTPRAAEGDRIQKGDPVATVSGPARAILSGERVALNFLQLLSGIATATAAAVAAVRGSNTQIIDTRKTVPGLRGLSKYAVRIGGGANHRFNLSDGILIKDNHIAAAGGIGPAVAAARAAGHHLLKIEVETETLAQIEEALGARADVIMLDNMTIPEMAAAVALIRGRALTEASGNMGGQDLAAVAAIGVDFISMGSLTHTVKALDISLRFSAGDCCS